MLDSPPLHGLRHRRLGGVLALVAVLCVLAARGSAEVVRIEIQTREPFAEGELFGAAGAYELVRGRLLYAVDPDLPANARVVDLRYAPRGPKGKVLFWGDFELLKPVDFAQGNRRLFYDVTNRGNKVILGNHNGAWGNRPSAGNGFLMQEGYSILWSGWNWDVEEGGGRLQIVLPTARNGDEPIRQRIAVEMVTSFDRDEPPSQKLCWGNARCYPAVDTSRDSPAVLTVRDAPRARREVIPRGRWRWGRMVKGRLEPSGVWITLDGGFEHGRIYELVYEAENPTVVGLGLVAVRDAISFFHFETADRGGTPNPLALPDPRGEPCAGVEKAYIYGTSQSGRFITHLIWQGFHVDEKNRMVFEGARIHAAGGGKGGFNHRFAQTSQHPSHLEGNLMPADFPPFWFLPDDHPRSGTVDDILAAAKRTGHVPRILITANELEYWTRSASLVHTSLDGTKDVPLHENVRLYVASGAPHRTVRTRERGVHEHGLNTMDVSPLLRAMVGHMDRWVSEGFAPPASRYPRLADGTLLSAAAHAARFPALPGMRHPGANLEPPRVGWGPRFWTEGILGQVPAVRGESYTTLVPAFDADGNPLGGVRLPDVAVPLGTWQGWNPRQRRYGAPGFLGRFEGSFWPFAADEEARVAAGDPRPSLAARYRDQEHYVALVEEACGELVDDGFLLPADADAAVERAAALAWPPRTSDAPPFWAVR